MMGGFDMGGARTGMAAADAAPRVDVESWALALDARRKAREWAFARRVVELAAHFRAGGKVEERIGPGIVTTWPDASPFIGRHNTVDAISLHLARREAGFGFECVAVGHARGEP